MGKRRFLGPALKTEMRKLRAIDYRSASRDEIEYIEEVAKHRRVEWQIRVGGVLGSGSADCPGYGWSAASNSSSDR